MAQCRTDDSMQMWDTGGRRLVHSYVAPCHERRTGTKVFNGMIACGNDVHTHKYSVGS